MDVITMARELGKALQQDADYLEFVKAKEANDADENLQRMIEQFNLLATTSEYESSKEDADQSKIEAYESQLHMMYDTIMGYPVMAAFEQAKNKVDEKMNNIVAILAAAVNGQDPMTFDPEEHHNCGGDCSHCHSCD